MMRFWFAIFLLLFAPGAKAAPIKAVASFTILADMLHEVGGDFVEVASLVGPNGDAHAYEPKPADSTMLGHAAVVVVNGLGFDASIQKVLQGSGFTGTLIVASEGVKPVLHGLVPDPHAWQDLTQAQIYISNITKGLCRRDAAHCEAFTANAAAYQAKLAALDGELKARFSAMPAASRQVVTTHDAFSYFAAAYGITFHAPLAFGGEAEPSAAAIASLVAFIRQNHITALFFENMTDSRVLQTIAAETHVLPGPPLYADALGSPGQGTETYLQMFRYNAETILKALAGK